MRDAGGVITDHPVFTDMDRKERKQKALLFIVLLLLILTAGAIFYMSSRDAELSMGDSMRIDEVLARIFVPGFSDMTEEEQYLASLEFDEPVRHAAHTLEFTALGFLIASSALLLGVRKWKIYSVVPGFLYGVSDELHQLFTAGRGCQITDLLFDFTGVLLGVMLVIYIVRSKASH